MKKSRANSVVRGLADDPQWYKDAIIYEVRVRSFYDTGGDGIGDFGGLTEKLEYLQRLGVTALWLLPFYPSPQRDDGYDISDYMDVHPDCGTLHDFRAFLKEAHRRGLYVITELVLNHTSDQHPWFQRARRAAAGSAERDFYVWSDTSDKYSEARIIFQDTELSNWSWDPVGKAYYWHRFFSHQPDLNFDNPAVRKAMLGVVDFWLGHGGGWSAPRRRPVSLRARRHELREPARDARFPCRTAAATSTAISLTGCCWRKRINGRRTPSHISPRERNAIWRSTSR